MGNRRWRARRTTIFPTGILMMVLLPGILVLAAGMASALVPPVLAAPREGCAGPVAGQRIYDCARLLTPAETADLETQATAVERAGAPTIVYLQARDASAQQALQDAIDLMNRWNVESRPGARDGFVMFFDLQPGNLRHGQVALYAGQRHYQHGNLPQSELDRIRTDVMTPLLKDEQTAAGIAAGLQMVAHDLRYGPPPPPAYQVAAAGFGRLPFTALAALFVGAVALLFLRLRRRPPMSGASDLADLGSLASPGDLPPAVAGALIKGRIADTQMEATILDFARRGLLVVEPVGKDKVNVRLLGDGTGLAGYEREVWNGLAARASRRHRTVAGADLADLRTGWAWPKSLLRRELVERGWYDPEAAAARRRPLYLAGAVGMVGVVAAIVLMVLSREGWAAIGLVLFLAAGVAAFVGGYRVPDTTVDGELAAASWRGYAVSVTDRAYEPNLDADLPYVVALGLLGKLAPRLKAASERGYAPAWFRAPANTGRDRAAPGVGFYPYWVAFHTSVTPVPSSGGSASGGYAGGGAAGGGGGSAGSF